MRGPHILTREFWTDFGQGYRGGWATGLNVGMALGILTAIASHTERLGPWEGVFSALFFALLWLMGARYGERKGYWKGEAAAAKRMGETVDLLHQETAAWREMKLDTETRAIIVGARRTRKMVGGVECWVEDRSGVDQAARRVIRGEDGENA